jgi:hypothetical protein
MLSKVYGSVKSVKVMTSLLTRRASMAAITTMKNGVVIATSDPLNGKNKNFVPLRSLHFQIQKHMRQQQQFQSRSFVVSTLPLFEKYTMKVPTMGDSITEVRCCD